MDRDDTRSNAPLPPAASALDARGGETMPREQGGQYSGMEYDGADHAVDRALAEGQGRRALGNDEADIPADNGRRAWIDEKTGEVHGSGVGAGGGQEGEDFDDDAATGDGPPA